MTDLQPGAETDRLVAEAIGWRRSEDFKHDWVSAKGRMRPIEQFTPSRSLEAAFYAAEQSQLFTHYNYVFRLVTLPC